MFKLLFYNGCMKRSKKNERDSKEWLKADYDVLKERAYMKRQMDARRKLSRLRIIRALAEK
jgi:hypothetical protein